MSDDLHYSSATKHKYDETSPSPQPPSLSSDRRSTGFSAPILPPPSSDLSPPSSGYNNNSDSEVNEIEIVKQRRRRSRRGCSAMRRRSDRSMRMVKTSFSDGLEIQNLCGGSIAILMFLQELETVENFSGCNREIKRL
ncbi:hypothetical protein Droror1_Dr00000115 [Drosera rotundifolia]